MAHHDDDIESLAVYGSLAPGEPNHWVVSRIGGDWVGGTAKGYQFEITWGPATGYQGFLPDPDGPAVPVAVLRSSQLAKKWREIDEFEGEGYQRTLTPVTIAGGEILAHLYVALTDTDD